MDLPIEVQNDIEDAFDDFELALTPSDLKTFRCTSLEDVRKTLRTIEREREQTGRLINFRRVEKLINTLDLLANNLKTILPDGLHLDHLWAPIKCLLQTADQSDPCLKKLLNAYALLNSHLAVLEISRSQYGSAQSSSSPVAYILVDILEFHRETYAILRRGGWLILFDSAWQGCLSRLQNIFNRLKKYREASNHVFTEDEWLNFRSERDTLLTEQSRTQKEQNERQLHSCFSWLGTGMQEKVQETLFDRRNDVREEGTCQWILKQSKFISWLDPDHRRSFLWLKGKPGSGKTTLATFISHHAEFPPGSVSLYCLCSQEAFDTVENPCQYIFRFFVTQILRQNPQLVTLVYEEYVRKAESLSLRTICTILRKLLLCLPFTYLIIDGLDECDPQYQQQILTRLDLLLALQRDEEPPRPELKILICSRETRTTPGRLRSEPTLCLTKEALKVSMDIHTYTQRHVKVLYKKFPTNIVDEISTNIVQKAGGMFLWVKLIISLLLSQQSLHDLQTTLSNIPAGLTGLYMAIIKRIDETPDDRAKQHIRAIFTWVAFSRRHLKSWELCDALVFNDPQQALSNDTMLNKEVLDLCKPLIEEHQDGTIAFVHFSVREFLLHSASGPYLQIWQAERAISTSCFRYLLTCNSFFQNLQTAQSFAEIIHGFHGLFPYVNEFWSSHLNSCFMNRPPNQTREVGNDYGDVTVHSGAVILGNQYFIVDEHAARSVNPDRALDQLGLSNTATRLTQNPRSRRYDIDWLYVSIDYNGTDPTNTSEPSDQVWNGRQHDPLENNSNHLHGYDLTSPEPQSDSVSKNRPVLEQLKEIAQSTWDSLSRTSDASSLLDIRDGPISSAFLAYQRQFEDSVENKCPYSMIEMDISETDLKNFYSRFSSTAYSCRWKGCARSNLGFASQLERQKHEKFHLNQFCCPEPGCEFSQNGLPSQAALKAHVRKYHLQTIDIPIPSFRSCNSLKGRPIGSSNRNDVAQTDYIQSKVQITATPVAESAGTTTDVASEGVIGQGQPITLSTSLASFPSMNYALQLQQQKAQQLRKLSDVQVSNSMYGTINNPIQPSNYDLQATNTSLSELDAIRDMSGLSHQNIHDLTPRNIYEERARQNESYRFPPTASGHSPISAESPGNLLVRRGNPYGLGNAYSSEISSNRSPDSQTTLNQHPVSTLPSSTVVTGQNPMPNFDWFRDHFIVSAAVSLQGQGFSEWHYDDCLQHLWSKLPPVVRSYLRKYGPLDKEGYRTLRKSSGLTVNELAVLRWGIHAYTKFCSVVKSHMSMNEHIWSHNTPENNIYHLWQRLQHEEKLDLNSPNSVWRIPLPFKAFVEGSDLTFFAEAFHKRFELSELVAQAFISAPDISCRAAELDPDCRWLRQELRRLIPYHYGDITLANLVRNIHARLSTDEVLLIEDHVLDETNVVLRISVNSMLVNLKRCLVDNVNDGRITLLTSVILGRQTFSTWIATQLDYHMPLASGETKIKACDEEWSKLTSAQQLVFYSEGKQAEDLARMMSGPA